MKKTILAALALSLFLIGIDLFMYRPDPENKLHTQALYRKKTIVEKNQNYNPSGTTNYQWAKISTALPFPTKFLAPEKMNDAIEFHDLCFEKKLFLIERAIK